MSEQLALQFNESAFRRHHAENPEIYEFFKRFAFEKIRAGATKLGGKAIWERIRWEAPVDRNGKAFKLDNNLTTWYVRLFQHDYPGLSHMFETRAARADVEAI
jgi:hypothetical protein